MLAGAAKIAPADGATRLTVGALFVDGLPAQEAAFMSAKMRATIKFKYFGMSLPALSIYWFVLGAAGAN
jgi:hypothetical protein